MKGLIIAAGRGSRLGQATNNTPKPLVKVKSKSFLENTISLLNQFGVSEIGVVTGYLSEKFDDVKGIKTFKNSNWKNNNILHSLFYAEDFINEDIVIVYGDTWYEKSALSNILKSKDTLSIAVDLNWREYYVGRSDHPEAEAENVIYDDNFNLQKIGKYIDSKSSSTIAEFMGIVKIDRKGVKSFVNEFKELKKKLALDDPFENSKSFSNAYLTDYLKYLVKKNYEIKCIENLGGWYEVDTQQDLHNLREMEFLR